MAALLRGQQARAGPDGARPRWSGAHGRPFYRRQNPLMALVELVRLAHGAEAELLRGRIESAGVHAVCFDAGMNIAESVGLMIPVRIMVLDEDLAEARALLAEFDNPGNDWPGNDWPGNDWPGNDWPGNDWATEALDR